MTWRSVGIVDNENMMVPHVLQQRYVPEQEPAKDPQDRRLVATDEHRLVSINDLDGVDE
jgi:hypothetical protein